MHSTNNLLQELYNQLREYKRRKREAEAISDYDGADFWDNKIGDLLSDIEKEEKKLKSSL